MLPKPPANEPPGSTQLTVPISSVRQWRLRSESAPFLLTLAGRQLESGKIDAAEATCERAARLHPTDRADQLRAAMAFEIGIRSILTDAGRPATGIGKDRCCRSHLRTSRQAPPN